MLGDHKEYDVLKAYLADLDKYDKASLGYGDFLDLMTAVARRNDEQAAHFGTETQETGIRAGQPGRTPTPAMSHEESKADATAGIRAGQRGRTPTPALMGDNPDDEQIFKNTLGPVKQVMGDTGLKMIQIDEGSTRIPKV